MSNIKKIIHFFLSGVATNSYVTAWKDAGVLQGGTPPTAAELQALATLMNSLEGLGLGPSSSRMKTWNVYGLGSFEMGVLNFKDTSLFEHTAIGTTPTVTQKGGVKSAGAGSCINTQYAANEYAGIETDLTTIVDINEAGATSGQRVTGGLITGNTAQRIQLNTNSRFMYAGAQQLFVNLEPRGVYVFTYDGANSVLYKDKVKHSVASTPIVPTNASKTLLLASNNSTVLAGGVTVDGSFTKNVTILARYDRLSHSEILAVTDIIENFKRSTFYSASEDWFVRAAGGSYGTEDGSTFANAFDGDAGMNWLSIQPNDVLYVCDTLNETLTVDIGRCIVDGGLADHPCTIDGDDTRLMCVSVNGMSYVTVRNITAIDATTDCIAFRGPGYGNVCEDCTVSGSGNQGFQNENLGAYTLQVTYNRVTSFDNVDDGMSLHGGSTVEVNDSEFYNNGQGVHAIADSVGVFNGCNIHDNSVNNVRADSTVDFTFNDCEFNNGLITNNSSVPIKLNNCDTGNCTLSGDFIIDGVPFTF